VVDWTITLADVLAIAVAAVSLIYSFAKQGGEIELLKQTDRYHEQRLDKSEREQSELVGLVRDVNSKLDKLIGREEARNGR
jgi:hypothetical protein